MSHSVQLWTTQHPKTSTKSKKILSIHYVYVNLQFTKRCPQNPLVPGYNPFSIFANRSGRTLLPIYQILSANRILVPLVQKLNYATFGLKVNHRTVKIIIRGPSHGRSWSWWFLIFSTMSGRFIAEACCMNETLNLFGKGLHWG
jgi:hypothetical protein